MVIPRPSVNPIQGGLRVDVDMASTPCPKRNLFKIVRTGVNVPPTGRFTFSIIWLTWIRITVTIQLLAFRKLNGTCVYVYKDGSIMVGITRANVQEFSIFLLRSTGNSWAMTGTVFCTAVAGNP